ncbi:o-succinylbenzoate synthase [Aureitalea sp. L0-47]|uniref:o-succinylbenzoate synthase n=1 Tax=Aureitalea sp. L0-47 TaxID=2816962 RepID=UPI002237F30C|nr:o-succinylbenzoate synthase [Aureitalea sp. L0-47]MCW5519850.1 o-succinylbenzoate synthase [Aureitalea sp. L0-47]
MEGIITLKRIELYLIDLPQKSTFKSGIGERKSKKTILVKWIDKEGRVGYGECSCRPDPFYSAEFIKASLILIQKFIIPRLQPSQSYKDVIHILNGIRGWNFTKSAVESAMYQVLKQQSKAKGLSDYLNSDMKPSVPVGISLGIYDDQAEMLDVVNKSIDEGYKRLKFKISPYVNSSVFESVYPLLSERNVQLSFDANGSFRGSDLEKLSHYTHFETHVEQPTPPDRFDLLLEARRRYPKLKICFDEEVESIGDVVKLHQLGLLDELNLKIGRVGGITSSIEILNYCKNHDIPCWMGGMFETGVGRLQNLELAAYLANAKANDLSPSSRYFVEDIISPAIEMDNGLIDVRKSLESNILQEKIDYYTLQSHEYSLP